MPESNVKFVFSAGYVSARDKSDLQPGEMVSGVGAYYKPGDNSRVWKEPGRSLHYNFSGLATDINYVAAVKGLALCQFELNTSGYDTASGVQTRNKLVAYVDDRLDYINPETTAVGSGILASGVRPSGLTNYDTDDRLFSVHYNDSWYLSTANGRPYVISEFTSQTPRRMGMLPPEFDIDYGTDGTNGLAISNSGTISLVPSTITSTDWWWIYNYRAVSILPYRTWDKYQYTFNSVYHDSLTNPSNVTDGDQSTYGYLRIGPGEKVIGFTEFTDFPSNSGTQDRWLQVRMQVLRGGGSSPGGGDVGIGTSLGQAGVVVRIELELDEDYYVPHPSLDTTSNVYIGTNPPDIATPYTLDTTKGRRVLYQQLFEAQDTPDPPQAMSIPAGHDVSGMKVRVSLQPAAWDWSTGTGTPLIGQTNPTVLRLYDVRVVDGSNSVLVAGNTISGVRYAVSEYDSNSDIESVPSEQSDTLWFEDRTGATFTLPSGSRNTNATHYNIYRSNLPSGPPSSGIDDAWNHFGQVGKIAVNATANVPYFDGFDVPILATPSPLVPTIAITQDNGLIIYKLRDSAPPPMRSMTVHKGSIVGVSNVNRRSLVYSYAGYPESFPDFHVIENFPLKEKDTLVGALPLDNTIIILTEGAILTMAELPQARLGRLVASDVDQIDGAPGCVGEYAFTNCELKGFPAAAYVSIHGVYVTDGHSALRISDDLDWDLEINRSTLDRAKLLWDKDFKHLIFIFDKDGDDYNDHKFIFHMDELHRKANGMPKVTGPTPAKLTDMAFGQVEEDYRIFSASAASQEVFIERSGTVDASNSYTTPGVVPFDIKTGEIYGDWEYWSVIRGNLRHTDWGNQNVTVNWTSARDDGDNSDTVTKTVSVNGHKGTEVFIGRLGEYHQMQISNFTSGTAGGIQHFAAKVQGHGSDAGDV